MNLDFRNRRLVRQFDTKIRSGQIRLVKRVCLCGSDDGELLAKYGAYGEWNRVVICRNCGLIYASPYFDADSLRWFYESDSYRVLYEGDDFLDSARRRLEEDTPPPPMVPMIRRWKEPGASVVEIGCGAGWHLKALRAAGYAVHGYEYSTGLARLGKAHGLDIRAGSPVEADEQYDIVVINHVLEHNPDIAAFLRAVTRLMKPDGILYVGVPNMEKYGPGQFQNAHCYYFTPPTLRHYLAREGLDCLALGPSRGDHMHGVFELARAVEPPPLSGEFARMKSVMASRQWWVVARNTLHHLVSYVP